ncbi:hypothetical protein SRHO_G00033510 [Serrasalmus rhombeus]
MLGDEVPHGVCTLQTSRPVHFEGTRRRSSSALRDRRETGAGLLKVFAGQYLQIQDHMLQHNQRHSVIQNNVLF